MTVVLVDARYYGDIMRQARKWLKIDSDTAAKILKIDRKEYRKYERGRAVMPRDVYMRLMQSAFSLLSFRRR